MGMFGKRGKWQQGLGVIGATLQDVGGSLGHGQTGYLDAYQQRQKDAQDKAARDTREDDAFAGLASAFGGADNQLPPSEPGAGPMDQIAGFAQGQRGLSVDPYSAIINAARAGVNAGPLIDFYQSQKPKPREFQGVNLGNGAFGSYDPQTNDFKVIHEATPTKSKPVYVEGPDGIYERDDQTGKWIKRSNWQQFSPHVGGGAGAKGGGTDAPPPDM